ncbi:MAG: hypothetical protein GY940_13715, partial [bacterium]|nr:hypothetical protein [bacterium]
GENFVEIVYRDEFKTPNPTAIPLEGTILTIQAPGLDSLSQRFDSISKKMGTLLDSVNRVIATKEPQESIQTTLENIKAITGNLKQISGDEGKLGTVFKDINQLGAQLKQVTGKLDKFVGKIDHSLFDDKDAKSAGILSQLKEAAGSIKSITKDLKRITGEISKGKGTAGKLLNDDGLYKKIDESVASVKTIIADLERKKKEIDKTTFGYYAGIDYFTSDQLARFAFGLDLDFSQFTLFTRVRDGLPDDEPDFTVMAGKKFKLFSAAAGMLDSGLGAALQFQLFNNKLNLGLEASRFYRENTPLLKTRLSFRIHPNLRLAVGLEDFMEKENRKFHIGLSFTK